MNWKYKTSSLRRRRSGLTLVEVVAGLALLSTLLVAVLMTKARVTRQWAASHRRLEAVAAADRLLVGWWQNLETFPRDASGRVPGDAGLSWRTTPVPNPTASALLTSVIRLEVIDDRVPGSSPAAVASVEIILDDERPAADVPAGLVAARATKESP